MSVLEERLGYDETVMRKIIEANVNIGDKIRVINGCEVYEGTLMPRPILGDLKSIVIKLNNGYNIGVRVSEETRIEKICGKEYFEIREVERPKCGYGEVLVKVKACAMCGTDLKIFHGERKIDVP
ncbi:MAG: alcohol dehydrogenase catalytic domain-containing protein, partial [Candidatus Methanomethylicia archaeon]